MRQRGVLVGVLCLSEVREGLVQHVAQLRHLSCSLVQLRLMQQLGVRCFVKAAFQLGLQVIQDLLRPP